MRTPLLAVKKTSFHTGFMRWAQLARMSTNQFNNLVVQAQLKTANEFAKELRGSLTRETTEAKNAIQVWTNAHGAVIGIPPGIATKKHPDLSGSMFLKEFGTIEEPPQPILRDAIQRNQGKMSASFQHNLAQQLFGGR